MSDTYSGDCRICGDYTDLIEDVCMDCQETSIWLNKKLKQKSLKSSYLADPRHEGLRETIIYLLQEYDHR